jgi:hypothetical protein
MRQLSMHDALEEQARCEHCHQWLYNACGGIQTPAGYVCNQCIKTPDQPDLAGVTSRS